MIIEGLRSDSLYIGSTDIRISQLLAFISFVTCLSIWIYKIKQANIPLRSLYILTIKKRRMTNERTDHVYAAQLPSLQAGP